MGKMLGFFIGGWGFDYLFGYLMVLVISLEEDVWNCLKEVGKRNEKKWRNIFKGYWIVFL